MTLKDFLDVVDTYQYFFIGITVCGMRFETKHSAVYYIKNGDDLKDREIVKVYTDDKGLHVVLKG